MCVHLSSCSPQGPLPWKAFSAMLIRLPHGSDWSVGTPGRTQNFPRLLLCCCVLPLLEARTFKPATSDERMLPQPSGSMLKMQLPICCWVAPALQVICLLLRSSGDVFCNIRGHIRWKSQQQLLGHGSHIPGAMLVVAKWTESGTRGRR